MNYDLRSNCLAAATTSQPRHGVSEDSPPVGGAHTKPDNHVVGAGAESVQQFSNVCAAVGVVVLRRGHSRCCPIGCAAQPCLVDRPPSEERDIVRLGRRWSSDVEVWLGGVVRRALERSRTLGAAYEHLGLVRPHGGGGRHTFAWPMPTSVSIGPLKKSWTPHFSLCLLGSRPWTKWAQIVDQPSGLGREHPARGESRVPAEPWIHGHEFTKLLRLH